MTIYEEVMSFAVEYCNSYKNQTKERKQKIASAYRQAFGRKMNVGCGTCYVEAIFEIKKFMEKIPSKYRLKPGVLLRAFGDESKTVTNKNLTDELAEYHLRTNPGTRSLFAIIPEEDTDSNLTIVEPVVKAVPEVVPDPNVTPDITQKVVEKEVTKTEVAKKNVRSEIVPEGKKKATRKK